METVKTRTENLYREQAAGAIERTNALFAALMPVQWVAAMIFAYWLSPRSWEGSTSQVHLHVYAAVLLGGAITSLPMYLALRRPTWTLTPHAIAVGQMLMSALLIHVTGGRIETHFHVFGSLAFLAFYRDWKVILTATVVVSIDHAVRGFLWPQSVYGVAAIQPMRFLEHAGWVVFEDVFLIRSIRQSCAEMRDIAGRQAQLEIVNATIESKVAERTAQLALANESVKVSEARRMQAEKLSAVGQLAAGVAHEINNPLGVILGFAQGMSRNAEPGGALELPIKSIEREALRCKALVQSLLTFARTSRADRCAMDLNRAVEQALALIQPQAKMGGVRIRVFMADGLPPILGNKNQLEQVIMNLAKNAIDAMPDGGVLSLTTALVADAPNSWVHLSVVDDGMGIPGNAMVKIFDPFFTTKPLGQGTGLGLSLVSEIVKKHSGEIGVESRPGRTAFTVKLPVRTGAELERCMTEGRAEKDAVSTGAKGAISHE